MIDLVGTPPFLRIALWVAMETMHLHIARISFFFRTKRFCIRGVPMNTLPPMKNCSGVGTQGMSY